MIRVTDILEFPSNFVLAPQIFFLRLVTRITNTCGIQFVCILYLFFARSLFVSRTHMCVIHCGANIWRASCSTHQIKKIQAYMKNTTCKLCMLPHKKNTIMNMYMLKHESSNSGEGYGLCTRKLSLLFRLGLAQICEKGQQRSDGREIKTTVPCRTSYFSLNAS